MIIQGNKIEYSDDTSPDQAPFFFITHNKYFDILVTDSE